MLVRLTATVSTADFTLPAGTEVTVVPDELAIAWVKAGYAVPVRGGRELAITEQKERAVLDGTNHKNSASG